MTREKIREVISKFEGHYHVEEDTFFCCSQCADCCDENRKDKPCDCGREKRIDKITDAILSALPRLICGDCNHDLSMRVDGKYVCDLCSKLRHISAPSELRKIRLPKKMHVMEHLIDDSNVLSNRELARKVKNETIDEIASLNESEGE
jgi:hypothetical protein